MSDMTRKEAIKMLESIVDTYDKCHDEEHLSVAVSIRKEDAKALDIAIQALEQIDILKEAYNKGYKDGQEAIAFHLELCKEEGSIIEIPEGVSNMELMQTVFHIDFTELRTKAEWMEWWNTPYRKEQKQ